MENPEGRNNLETFLRSRYRFHVEAVEESNRALQTLKTAQPRYDLVIMDDGGRNASCRLETLKQIKHLQRDIRVIFIAAGNYRYYLDARKAGAILCFGEPINVEELAFAIRFSFEHHRYRRERKMLDKLHELSVALNSALELHEILKLTCKAAVEIFNVDHSGVVLFEKNLLKGKVIAEFPTSENFVETEIQVKGITLEERLVYHREIINISDLWNSNAPDNVQQTLIGLNIRSVLIVPVVLNGRVIASFSLDMIHCPRIFQMDEIDLCKKLANQVAIAIGKARYVQELSVINQIGHDIGYAAPMDLGVEKMVSLVRKHTGTLIDVTNFYIALYDEETGLYRFPYHEDEKDEITAIPHGQLKMSLTDYVRRKKEAVLVDSAKSGLLIQRGEIQLVGTPTRIWLGAPLIARNNVLGVMVVQDYESENTFDQHDLTILQTIASQTAIAIDNARLFEGLRKQRDNQVKAVRQISAAIAASVDQGERFRRILEGVTSLICEADMAEIRLYNPQSETLNVIASLGGAAREEYGRLPIGKGVTGWVAEHKEPALVWDVSKDPRYLPMYDGTGSEIAVPLLKDDLLIGVLNIEHEGVGAFEKEDLALAESIAGLAVVAIDNARLYDDLDQKVKDLEEANRNIARTRETLTRAMIAGSFIHRLNNLAATIPVRVNMALEKLDPKVPKDNDVIHHLKVISGHSGELLKEAREIEQNEEKLAPEHFVIDDLVETAIKKVFSYIPKLEKHICVERFYSKKRVTLYLEKYKLLEPLVNIIRNAVEAMEQGGRLGLRTALELFDGQPSLIIAVSDTGMGIPGETLPRIFERHFTTKQTGLGIGLWGDKIFIRDLGGDIDVKSRVGEGSTFTIRIPFSPTDGGASPFSREARGEAKSQEY